MTATTDKPTPRMDPTKGRRSTMTDAEAERLTASRSEDPITLPKNRLPCLVCGVAVPVPTGAGQVTHVPITGHGPNGSLTPSAAGDPAPVAMTRCETCTERSSAALRLAASHPALVSRVGNHRAIEAAEGVLTALALLDRPAPTETISDAELGILVRNLANAGLAVQWRSNAATRRGLCNPHPFAHVRLGDRQDLRTRAAHGLRERVTLSAPPERIEPPTPTRPPGIGPVEGVTGGCMVCGVEYVEMPAAQVVRLGGREIAAIECWTPLTANVGALGGKTSTTKVTGHLCPACAETHRSVASVGPTFRERALLDHLRRTGQHEQADALRARLADTFPPPIPAWCVTGTEPSGTPWRFLSLP